MHALGAAIAAAAMIAAAPTYAAALDFERVYRGTLVSTYPDGRQARIWLDRNGEYRAANRRGKPSSGHWKIARSRVCFLQARPFPAPFSFCTPLPARVDRPWTGKAATGEPVTITLVDGR
jgi:hypothetical protein